MRSTGLIAQTMAIVGPEEEYFVSPDGQNLYHTSIERTGRWGKYAFMIVGIRLGPAGESMPYGLAGFSLS